MNTEKNKLASEGLADTKAMAAYLNISQSMVAKLRKAGAIKEPVKIGASSRWDVAYIRKLAVDGVSLPKSVKTA